MARAGTHPAPTRWRTRTTACSWTTRGGRRPSGTPPAASTRTGLRSSPSSSATLGLLTRGTYDAETRRSRPETLRKRTLATIKQFAATNRLTGGSVWGKQAVLRHDVPVVLRHAARLLWADLDDEVRADIDAITREQAQFTTGLGTADDPASGDWTPHGREPADSSATHQALEEMGVYARSTLPPSRERRTIRATATGATRSAGGAATRPGCRPRTSRNPARVDGVPVAAQPRRRTSTTRSSSRTTARSARTTRKNCGAPRAQRRPLPARRAGAARSSPTSRTRGRSGAPCSR